jgi:hypothetical protein
VANIRVCASSAGQLKLKGPLLGALRKLRDAAPLFATPPPNVLSRRTTYASSLYTRLIISLSIKLEKPA